MLSRRILSILLVAIMLLSSVAAISVSAEETAAEDFVPTFNTGRDNPVSKDFYRTGIVNGKNVEVYGDNVVDTPEERIALMDLRLEKGDLQLYIDAFSGEVAVKNKRVGLIPCLVQSRSPILGTIFVICKILIVTPYRLVSSYYICTSHDFHHLH